MPALLAGLSGMKRAGQTWHPDVRGAAGITIATNSASKNQYSSQPEQVAHRHAGTLADLVAWRAERVAQGGRDADPFVCSVQANRPAGPVTLACSTPGTGSSACSALRHGCISDSTSG